MCVAVLPVSGLPRAADGPDGLESGLVRVSSIKLKAPFAVSKTLFERSRARCEFKPISLASSLKRETTFSLFHASSPLRLFEEPEDDLRRAFEEFEDDMREL